MPHLKEEDKNMYVHEVTCIGASNGEVYLSHDGGVVVFNATTLLSDLPTIVRLVKQEYSKELERVINNLKLENEE